MKKAFTKFSQNVSDKDINQMFKAYDKDNDGTIDIKEFKKMITKDNDNFN